MAWHGRRGVGVTRTAHEDLVRDLAERVVNAVAPAEAELFPMLADAYLDDPAAALAPAPPKDDALGAGLSAEIIFLVPPVMYVAHKVVDHLIELVTAAGVARGKAAIRDAARRIAGIPSDPPGDAPPAAAVLSRAQLTETHQRALAAAQRVGLPPATARQVAAEMLVRVVIDPSDGSSPRPATGVPRPRH
jgi:hypothetical protein